MVRGKKILITGGAGFIASHLIERFRLIEILEAELKRLAESDRE